MICTLHDCYQLNRVQGPLYLGSNASVSRCIVPPFQCFYFKVQCASIPMPLFQGALCLYSNASIPRCIMPPFQCLYFKVHCACIPMPLFHGALFLFFNASIPRCIVPPFQCLYFLAPTSRFKCASILRFILSPSLSKMRRCLVKECAPISKALGFQSGALPI